MKNLNFIYYLSLGACLIIAASCEKNYQIGGYFVNEFEDKPIAGLEIGLYKGLIDSNSTLNNLELRSSTFTDSSGRFDFEIGEDELSGYYYFPTPTSDTNSINSKYVISPWRINNIDWSKTRKWTLLPSAITYIVFDKSEILDTLVLKYNNQISYGNEQLSGEVIYTLFLIPGKSYSIELYTKNGNEEKYFKSIDVFIKSVIVKEDKIQWIQPEIVEIKIDSI